MMEFAPSMDKKRHIYGHLHHGSHTSLYNHHNNSSSSLHAITHTPNIEKQLQSLLIEEEDTQEDTAELLQQTFAQLEVDLSPSSPASPSSTEKSTTCKSSTQFSGGGRGGEDEEEGPKDFSAFTSPFEERPTVTGNYSYYIPAPTSVRNYLDHPDIAVLKNMSLPYPFRVREPRSQRLERINDYSTLRLMNILNQSHYRQHHQRRLASKKRHSLDIGQVDGFLKIIENTNQLAKAHRPSFPESILSQQTLESIISWLPDKNMKWQDVDDDDDDDDDKKQERDKNIPRISIDIPMVHPLD